MKKLMMFAAAVTLVGSASAAISFPGSYTNCSSTGSTCGFYGFTFKESGKSATLMEKKGYKTVFSFTGKGGLGVNFSGSDSNNCCTVGVTFALKTKIDGKTVRIVFNEDGTDENFTSYTIFGKNIDKVADILENHEGTAGKFYTVETDLGFALDANNTNAQLGYTVDEAYDSATPADSFVDLAALPTYFYYSGFGTVQFGLSKAKTGSCNNAQAGCEPLMKGMKYSGYFAGYVTGIEKDTSMGCLRCACEDNVIFGGTWTATLNEKYTALSDVLGTIK